MASSQNVEKLVDFIRSEGLETASATAYGYNHMGATLSDAILQAGLNYKTVVQPRVRRIINHFPNDKTTSQFLDLMDAFGLEHVINWQHPEKLGRLVTLANFFYVRSVETENCLRDWIQSTDNCSQLLNLRGVGPKTVDYLKMLSGCPAVAVDRHIRAFVKNAGIMSTDYASIRQVVEQAADRLNVVRTDLDFSIWNHVSQRHTSKHHVNPCRTHNPRYNAFS